LGIDRPSLSYLFFFFIDEPTRTTSIKNLKKQQQPKNCAQPKKDKGWIWWWDLFRVIRFSLSNVTKISFESLFLECVHFVYKWLWSFFALWTHPNYVKISAGTSFHVSMICYQFSQIVFSFYCLLTIFPLFNLSLIQLLPQFATWFSLDLIASTCHLSVLIIYLWNASHKKKGITTTQKILMIIIYFYNFVLKFIYTLCNDSLSKAQPPPFNDTYLHALSYKTFYNSFFFSSLIICLFIFYQASMIFITFFLSLSW